MVGLKIHKVATEQVMIFSVSTRVAFVKILMTLCRSTFAKGQEAVPRSASTDDDFTLPITLLIDYS
jgi:hypothetical protein